MTTFSVSYFYPLPTKKEVSARRIDRSGISDFWEECDLHSDVGVYVMCVKASKGYKPWYVGQTTSKFSGEVFQPHKIEKFNDCLAKIRKGTPGIVFIYKIGPGRASADAISDLELEYINKGFAMNSRLLNDRRIKKQRFQILGIGTAGKPSQQAQVLKKIFGI